MSTSKQKKIGTHSIVSNRLVDPRELTLNPENERTYIAADPSNVSLRQSLLNEGVLKALEIYEDGVVDDGNCRLFNIGLLLDSEDPAIKAAAEEKFSVVPAIIVERPLTPEEGVFRRFNKNEAHQFAPLDQGGGFAKLRTAGHNNAQIAARTPFSAMHIGNMLTLNDASEDVRTLVREDKISATLAVETIRKHGEETILTAMEAALMGGKDRVTQRWIDAVTAPAETEIEVTADATPPGTAPFDGGSEVEVDPSALSTETPSGSTVAAEVEVETPDAGSTTEVEADANAGNGAGDGEGLGTEAEVTTTTSTVNVRTMTKAFAPTVVDLLAIATSTKMSNKSRLESLERLIPDLKAFVETATALGIIAATVETPKPAKPTPAAAEAPGAEAPASEAPVEAPTADAKVETTDAPAAE